jgi:hypothetical protein
VENILLTGRILKIVSPLMTICQLTATGNAIQTRAEWLQCLLAAHEKALFVPEGTMNHDAC